MAGNDQDEDGLQLSPVEARQPNSSGAYERSDLHFRLNEICEQAERGTLLSLSDFRAQFGVRHLLLLTSTFSILMFAQANWGFFVAAHFVIPCTLIWAWIVIAARERQRDLAARRKVQQLIDELQDQNLDGIDVNTVWHLYNRNLR